LRSPGAVAALIAAPLLWQSRVVGVLIVAILFSTTRAQHRAPISPTQVA